MKRFIYLLLLLLLCSNSSMADETARDDLSLAANQEIKATENKLVVVVQKQPLNENSNQVVILKKNWLGVFIQVNGKVKIQPLTNTYEVE